MTQMQGCWVQAEQLRAKQAEAKLASFTGTLQQRLLHLATEVQHLLHPFPEHGAVALEGALQHTADRPCGQ